MVGGAVGVGLEADGYFAVDPLAFQSGVVVGVGVAAVAMIFVVLPMAFVYFAVAVKDGALAVFFVVLELPQVQVVITKYLEAETITLIVLILTKADVVDRLIEVFITKLHKFGGDVTG